MLARVEWRKCVAECCVCVLCVVTCRDRDPSINRFRKRPSMLSEFHGKHYNHRDSERERYNSYVTWPPWCDFWGLFTVYFSVLKWVVTGLMFEGTKVKVVIPCRTHSPGAKTHDRHSSSGTPHYKSEASCSSSLDPRRHAHSHHHSRSSAGGYHSVRPPQYNSDGAAAIAPPVDLFFGGDPPAGETPAKKRRLLVEASRHAAAFDAPNVFNSTNPSASSAGGFTGHGWSTAPLSKAAAAAVAMNHDRVSPQGSTGLSAYLEDIDSDDDIRDEEEEEKMAKPKLSTAGLNTPAAPLPPSFSSPPPHLPPPSNAKTSPSPSPSSSPSGTSGSKHTKEGLLQMMEKVDRDIAALEVQVQALVKKKVHKSMQWCMYMCVCVCMYVCM